jgi:hypothetical protein
MNRTSPGTNALRHGSCRALVCRCRRASAAVVGGPIPLHATYVTSTTPTTDDDDIPTHATVCPQRLPLASTTYPLMLQYAASAYHWRRRHTIHPCYALLHFSPPQAGSAPQAMPNWAHNRPTRPCTDFTWSPRGCRRQRPSMAEWRRRQWLSMCQGPSPSVLQAAWPTEPPVLAATAK